MSPDEPQHSYRAFLLGTGGHISYAVELDCQDDAAARAEAELLVDDHDVELWDGPRKIAEFKEPAP
jgi:hypothetical protein